MKIILVSCFIIVVTTGLVIPKSAVTGKNPVVFETFAGTTPCSNVIRPLHNIHEEPDCDMVKCRCVMVEWKLTFYKDPATGEPTYYKLSSINRFINKETNMYSQPGTKTESTGKFSIVRGNKTNSKAILYRLDPGQGKIPVDFLKLSDNLLHVLDHDGNLMIGNEFWSYTLNKVADK